MCCSGCLLSVCCSGLSVCCCGLSVCCSGLCCSGLTMCCCGLSVCCSGRRISSTGRRDLDRIASQVAGKGHPAK